MTTVEVNILADEDQDFVMSILTALAQKHIIEFDRPDSFSAEGPDLTDHELVNRIQKSEQGTRYSFEEAKAKLGL
ncbi:hypothetical protein [Spirosoma fluviale]|uniref:Uncharacterized protein n=1 Tax=Spirosoma fluviale TaxID=1597977 RepID=A0A286G114_9BACT|nr:hypothetical protein [Spirosoma fluviale]SOD89230.1 hypothetical protein SAMN06269250_2994 [Spirosoma fluviale]